MKRSLPLILLVLAAGFAGPSAIAQEAELAAPIKACIDNNASKVEKAVSSLTDATSFLVESVCADSIAAEQSRLGKLASQKMVEHYQQLCAAEKSPPPKSSDPDEGPSDPCAMAKSIADSSFMTTNFIFAARQPQPGPTSYAAKLLLSLRLAHTPSNP